MKGVYALKTEILNKLTRPVLDVMKPYSPGKPLFEVQKELGLEKVIMLASNENPLGVSPKAIEAINQYVSQLNRYPDASTTNLRKAIGEHHSIDDDHIIVGNGADEIITLISETFLDAGDEVIVPSPSFSEYTFATHLMGAKVVKVPLTTTFEYDLNAITQAVTNKTKVIYLCSPNNPTGTYIDRRALEQFFMQLPDNLIVVYDSAYSHYVTEENYSEGIEYIKKGYPIIVLQTFSKVYGLAGIRVGYGMSSPDIINSIHKVREPFNVNALAQVAAIAALRDKAHVTKSQKKNEEGRQFLYNAFDKLGISYVDSMSNFILVDMGEEASAIYEQLFQKGIIVRNGSVFGLPHHMRITVGNHTENKVLIEVLESIV